MVFAALGLLIAFQPAAPVTPAPSEFNERELSPDELAAIEQDAARAVDEAVESMEQAVQDIGLENDRFERQLQFCRTIPEMLDDTDWTAVAAAQIGRDAALGPRMELMERCMFYLHGRGDILAREVAADTLQQP